jgi:class 3 adenylate cyclase
MACAPSLRVVIAVWTAFAVIVVAVITLSMTLTSSLEALRSLGRSHATSLLFIAEQQAEAFFAGPAKQAVAMQNLARSEQWPHPSDDRSAFTTWDAVLRQVYLETYNNSAVGLLFLDGSAVFYNAANSTMYYADTFYATPPYSGGAWSIGNYSGKDSQRYFDRTTSAFVREDPEITDMADMFRRNGVWNTLVVFGTTNGKISVFSAPYPILAEGRVQTMLPLLMPLHRRDDPPDAPPYACMFSTIQIDEISLLLRTIGGTANTAAFAVDSLNYIVATSLWDFQTTRAVDVNYRATRAGCKVTAEIGLILGDKNSFEVCRTTREAYGFGPLAAMTDALVHTDDAHVGQLTYNGESYFVAAARVKFSLPGMRLQLVLIMPENDVLGDVVKSRNIAIAGSVITLTVVCGVSFAFISWVLRPLTHVAKRMVRAAALEDDEEPEAFSSMQEIRHLQAAYVKMNLELLRIRSFVPEVVREAAWGEQRRRRRGGFGDSTEADDSDTPGSMYAGTPTATMRTSTRSRRTEDSTSTTPVRDGGVDEFVNAARSPRSASWDQFKRDAAGSKLQIAHAKAASASTRPARTPLDLAISGQTVTVCVFNCDGFHSVAEHRARSNVVADLGALVDLVGRIVRDNGGVVATYHGDHFVTTFNAARKNVNHARCAIAAALDIIEIAPTVGAKLGIRAGVATGRCLVGNVGGANVKSYSVLGSAFVHATLMERLTRRYAVRLLCTRRTCDESASMFRIRFLDMLVLPSCDTHVTLIGTVMGRVGQREQTASPPLPASAPDQWLFVDEHAATVQDTAFELHNHAFRALCAGRTSEAMQFRKRLQHALEIEDLSHSHNGLTLPLDFLNELVDTAVAMEASPLVVPRQVSALTIPPLERLPKPTVASDLGTYYHTAYGVSNFSASPELPLQTGLDHNQPPEIDASRSGGTIHQLSGGQPRTPC